MENTAAIFYRETDLLADSATACAAGTFTHSPTRWRMWFGDLVTMQWWDDL
jgi:aminopeptidase N